MTKKNKNRTPASGRRWPTAEAEHGARVGTEDQTSSGRLWVLSCKVRGIGELIKYQGGEPALERDDVNYGIGCILTELADEIDEIDEAGAADGEEHLKNTPDRGTTGRGGLR